MSDEPNDRLPSEQFDDLQQSAGEGALTPKEHFEKTSKIGLLMAYDLIDKLRFWEKFTLDLPEEEIAKRLDHLVKSVEQLREAYLAFTELDE